MNDEESEEEENPNSLHTEEMTENFGGSKQMRMSQSTKFGNTLNSLQRPTTGAKSTRLSSARSTSKGTFSQQLELDHNVIQLDGELFYRDLYKRTIL